MHAEKQAHECKEILEKLVGKKIVDIDFKSYDDECWRIYINTDHGKMVMTFCREWNSPVVEHRHESIEKGVE